MIRRPPKSTRTDTLFPYRRSSDLILRLPEQTPEHFAVDRHRAPRDVGIGQHADQRGMLEGVQLFLAKPHQLAAAQLPIAQVIEGLGDNGLVEWVWCGHAGLPRSHSRVRRSEEHTSELQSLMRISYAVFCLKKKNQNTSSE